MKRSKPAARLKLPSPCGGLLLLSAPAESKLQHNWDLTKKRAFRMPLFTRRSGTSFFPWIARVVVPARISANGRTGLQPLAGNDQDRNAGGEVKPFQQVLLQ